MEKNTYLPNVEALSESVGNSDRRGPVGRAFYILVDLSYNALIRIWTKDTDILSVKEDR